MRECASPVLDNSFKLFNLVEIQIRRLNNEPMLNEVVIIQLGNRIPFPCFSV
jgi:hypothetical protein